MRNLGRYISGLVWFCVVAIVPGCGGDEVGNINEPEVITTITLTATPTGGGASIVAGVDDPDGDGGNPPIVTPLVLSPGTYDMTINLQSKLSTPPADITQEVRDEGITHQLFFTGPAVNGPASAQPAAPLGQAYADADSNGLPVGLANKITASAGAGLLTITLRHMPAVNGVAVKTAALAETVRTMGFSGIGGSTDLQVNLPVTVQ
ncbi:MAG: hypothetical protein SF187_01560 [Deltaproteobacteria bacterium]|nr:hypothetical protein [Deltaproteobacteria bacterium]